MCEEMGLAGCETLIVCHHKQTNRKTGPAIHFSGEVVGEKKNSVVPGRRLIFNAKFRSAVLQSGSMAYNLGTLPMSLVPPPPGLS